MSNIKKNKKGKSVPVSILDDEEGFHDPRKYYRFLNRSSTGGGRKSGVLPTSRGKNCSSHGPRNGLNHR